MNPFLAEIRMFPFNFAPTGWSQCNGQLLPIPQMTALFSLLGTTYGGDGRSSFALPNMQDSAPMSSGQGPGLSLYDLGEPSGSSTITLLTSEIPAHIHALKVSNQQGDVQQPTSATSLARPVGALPFSASGSPPVNMAFQALAPIGSSQPHNNMMPYLVVNFCIALSGVYPPRN
jgi:microcystin-dependent protein